MVSPQTPEKPGARCVSVTGIKGVAENAFSVRRVNYYGVLQKCSGARGMNVL